MSDKYCILPSGNSHEFPSLDEELIRRGVTAYYAESPRGMRIYWIPESELSKLPLDEGEPYLGDDSSGHSIYDFPSADEYRSEVNCGEWQKV